VVLVNYINYIEKDREKLNWQINLIQSKIEKEKRLNNMEVNLTSLKLNVIDYFFDSNITYSQSMGKVQEIINTSAKGLCEVEYIKWAQSPISKSWYQNLKFNISLQCTPKNIILFVNKVREKKKLIIFRDVTLLKIYKKDFLKFNAKLIAFKVKNETK